MRLPASLVRQKFRFDIGQGIMSIINFAFIVLIASDKIATFIKLPAKVTVAILVPTAIFGVWFIGFVLDKMQFSQVYQEENNKRNEMLSAVHSSIKND